MIAACPAPPVQLTTRPPLVQARPAKSGITAHVFAYDATLGPTFALWTHGVAPAGSATKVLWVVRKTAVGRTLELKGRELSTGQTFHQSFARAGTSSIPGANYPSIVDIPAAGCWRLELSTRGFKASVVVRAVDQ